ncbi:MAG: gamma-glutamyltransferase, partial [Gammaproteobacteria bacterium]|nr:gamma-glutamyltransferase [Gammaproteobacteria bacterium]
MPLTATIRFTMWIAVLAVMLDVAPTAASDGGDRYTGEVFSSRSPVLARNGMAATSHPIASSIAVDVLRNGGSAVDAAIAANAMLALVEPHACGIGGDLFAIVWDPESAQLHGYNGSGRSPAGFSYAEMKDAIGDARDIPRFGPLSISVPGAVDGWFALHERFGRLPIADLLKPAVEYAREGIAVTEVDAALWQEAMSDFANLGLPEEVLAELRRVYTVDGRTPQPGEIFSNRDLAGSYARIADGGRESFYQGEIARQIVAAITRTGGALTAEDLRRHKGEWVDPMSVNYRGFDVFELPPNSQGIAALQILNLIEAYPLGDWGRDNADYWHVMIEASKIAYEDRARYYADQHFAQQPTDWLISKDYAEKRRRLIDMSRSSAVVAAGSPPDRGDTTY